MLEAKGKAFSQADFLVNLDDGSRHCNLLWKKFFYTRFGRDFGYTIFSFYLVAIFSRKSHDMARYAKKMRAKMNHIDEVHESEYR
jgi:hypothetical protein